MFYKCKEIQHNNKLLFRTYGIVAKTAGALAQSYMSASSGFAGAAASSGSSGLTNKTSTGAPWANWEKHYV